MRLATIRQDRGTTAAVARGDAYVALDFPDVGSLLEADDWASIAETADGPELEVDLAGHAPLVPRPGKIVCLGLNYGAHIEEMGREKPTHPTLFAKYATSLIGAGDAIEMPGAPSEFLDYEAELAFVIGRRARFVRGDEAEASIAGYTVLNDISERDYQRRTLQWLQGKTFDRTTPLGPQLVTRDEVGSLEGRTITCAVNGEVRQQASCGDLVFDPVSIVEYLSDIMTLLPGDVVATGTPGGVGAGFDPPRYLRRGDVVTTAIDGIGECTNVCTAAG